MSVQRKPIHLEQRGGKSNRQRIWEEIRASRDRVFMMSSVALCARVHYDTVRTYVQALVKAGFVEPAEPEGKHKRWKLVKDNGVDAPQLKRDGTQSTAGLGNEAMWRTLRMLDAVTPAELASFASAGDVQITENTAQSYLTWLEKAGYVRHVGQPRRYTLIKSRVTGPRPPQIQRVGQVYDPNTAAVVYAQSPEDLL